MVWRSALITYHFVDGMQSGRHRNSPVSPTVAAARGPDGALDALDHASSSLPGEFEKLSLANASMRRVCVPQRYDCFRFAVRKSQHFRRKSICRSNRHFCSCIRQFVFPIILTAVLIPLPSLGATSNPQPSTESTPLVLCTGAMSNRHVPTGDTSLISLNAARRQGIPAIP